MRLYLTLSFLIHLGIGGLYFSKHSSEYSTRVPRQAITRTRILLKATIKANPSSVSQTALPHVVTTPAAAILSNASSHPIKRATAHKIIKGIAIAKVERMAPITSATRRSVWRSLSLTQNTAPPPTIATASTISSITKAEDIPSHQNNYAEYIEQEKQARTAQVIWAWEKWWDKAIEQAQFEIMPESARCMPVAKQWRCVLDESPSQAITLESEDLVQALDALRNSLGMQSVLISHTQEGSWHIQIFNYSDATPPSITKDTTTLSLNAAK